MKKKSFLLDTSLILSAPHSVFAFDDNIVLIPETVIREVKTVATTSTGETRANAREFGLILDELSSRGNLVDGINLANGGQLRVILGSFASVVIAAKHCIEILNYNPDSFVIVSRDPFVRVTANCAGIRAEEFKSEAVQEGVRSYDGRCVLYVPEKDFNTFAKNGALNMSGIKGSYTTTSNGESLGQDYQLSVNEYVVLVNSSNPNGATLLGCFNGSELRKLYAYGGRENNPLVFGVTPRNVGQIFALDALLAPPSECPLVILKGPAGTGKTFITMAAALAQTIDTWGENDRYRRILISRPNAKMDEDIGFLRGSEVEKVLPSLRGLGDNIENLMPGYQRKMVKDGENHAITAMDSLISQGIISAQSMAYLRGRSITNEFICFDETQNATINQILSLITRAGEGSKLVILGDPDQIDHPYLDKRTNGLCYASERMRGSKLCRQITFSADECTRSPLASEAIERLTPKGAIY